MRESVRCLPPHSLIRRGRHRFSSEVFASPRLTPRRPPPPGRADAPWCAGSTG